MNDIKQKLSFFKEDLEYINKKLQAANQHYAAFKNSFSYSNVYEAKNNLNNCLDALRDVKAQLGHINVNLMSIDDEVSKIKEEIYKNE